MKAMKEAMCSGKRNLVAPQGSLEASKSLHDRQHKRQGFPTPSACLNGNVLIAAKKGDGGFLQTVRVAKIAPGGH